MAKAKYWMKFYHRTLDDPDVALLPDNLWRRFFEVCLMAGENGGTGWITRARSSEDDIKLISFRVRRDIKTVTAELGQLAMAGLVERALDDAGVERWFVTNFARLQAPSPAAERMREYRKRKAAEKVLETAAAQETPETAATTRQGPPRFDELPEVQGPDLTTEDRIWEIITAMSGVVKERHWSKTEATFREAARTLQNDGITAAQVAAFGEYWEANCWYEIPGRPNITTLMDEIQDSLTWAPADALANQIPDEYAHIIRR